MARGAMRHVEGIGEERFQREAGKNRLRQRLEPTPPQGRRVADPAHPFAASG